MLLKNPFIHTSKLQLLGKTNCILTDLNRFSLRIIEVKSYFLLNKINEMNRALNEVIVILYFVTRKKIFSLKMT